MNSGDVALLIIFGGAAFWLLWLWVNSWSGH